MYFNLETGITSDRGDEPCCHRGDNNLFFECGGAMMSWYCDGTRAEILANLIRSSFGTTEYVSYDMIDGTLLELQDEKEGVRTLFIGDGMTFCFTLSVQVLQALADFLIQQWEVQLVA